MKTIAEVSKETLQIENVLKTLPPGTIVTYQELQDQSGVKMDGKGKSYLRTATNRLKLQYSPIRGIGIKLCCPETATSIIASKVIGIDNKVKKAAKSTKIIQEKFYDKLSPADQQHVNIVSSVFGFIRSYSQSAKKQLFTKEKHTIANI